MRVRNLGPDEGEIWERYLESHPEATLYHRWAWRGVMERSFRHDTLYLMAERDGRAVGALPLVHLRSRVFGSILCSMPFLNYGGILADDAESEEALIAETRRLVERRRVDYAELRHRRPSAAGLPSKQHKVSMMVRLDPDPDTLWTRFRSKHRREIRKAEAQGFEIRFGRRDLLDPFYGLILRGWRDHGTPVYRKSFFGNILDALGDAVEIVLVTHRGRPVATAFDGFHGNLVEGMWTYALPEYAPQYVNYFLYWRLIRRGCERGYERYHLGRSTADSGAQRFKAKWTAEPVPLSWDYVMRPGCDLPDLSVDNPKFRFAIAAWRKLPVAVTRIVGPVLARSIP